jgi:L-2-hydroxyglutarate oxidase LhgO
MPPPAVTDVILIGGGVMSAHVGALLKSLDPRLSVHVLEAANDLARESSDGWNNAGTGHAGLCELNYTPPSAAPGGALDVSSALSIFARFERSRHFWGWAAAHGLAPRPADYIRAVPHLSFVRGTDRVAFLRARHAALTAHPFFRSMAFAADPAAIHAWAPLLIEGRRDEPVAATKVDAGTDVDFGELSRRLLAWIGAQDGCRVWTGRRVVRLRRAAGFWELTARDTASGETEPHSARFVFVGAGGGTLPLLQSAGLPVARGLGAFPIAGQWLVCANPTVVDRHFAKVYGPPPADSGALGGATSSSGRSPRGRRSFSTAPAVAPTSPPRCGPATCPPSCAPGYTSACSSASSSARRSKVWIRASPPFARFTRPRSPPTGASSTPASACRPSSAPTPAAFPSAPKSSHRPTPPSPPCSARRRVRPSRRTSRSRSSAHASLRCSTQPTPAPGSARWCRPTHSIWPRPTPPATSCACAPKATSASASLAPRRGDPGSPRHDDANAK